MTKRLTRIAPWQAGKLFALVYFLFGLIFAILFLPISLMAPPSPPGAPPHPGPGLVILFPFLYGVFGLILGPVMCCLYNVAARLVGGLEVTVTDDADA